MAKDKKQEEIINYGDRIRHIAFIMDGNGRWATRRGLPRIAGHAAGAAAFRRVVTYCVDHDIRHMTFYAFSTENWARPQQEIDRIMSLISEFISEMKRLYIKHDLRVVFIGDRSRISPKLAERMIELEDMSKNCGRILNLALNYGGREEIVHAVNALISEGRKNITEDDISSHLFTSLSPDPDLIIRTANELRLSNFLLWQAAYSEFWFTDKLWPDITGEDIERAITDFLGRKRRFGGLDKPETQ